ncbi:phosphatidate cytidylyltransferase [Zooshikella ganghwensis]|uniref:phosphatidate cytidylyltransferase n=1 Tax=Zooshikella ganghwensis TaxID=202772 RepID=UPI00040D7BA3|nr:phosphatidate cytidylyltransferase [Zooshikella ganghwensis]
MLKQRILTAAILAPIVLVGVLFLDLPYFSWFIGAITTLGAWEWANLSGWQQLPQRVGYTLTYVLIMIISAMWIPFTWGVIVSALWWCGAVFLVVQYPKIRWFWEATTIKLAVGFLVLLAAWQAFVLIKMQANSSSLIVFLLLLIWGADSGAYFAGKRFGKHKLAPRVSPGKSWEGVAGGLAVITLLTFIFAWYWQLNWIDSLLLTAIAWLVVASSVLGDLVESMFKREQGLKDSSQLLPGHGGVLDRIDSLTAAAPVLALLLVVIGL